MDYSPLNIQNEALGRFGQSVFNLGIQMKQKEDERNRTLGLLEFNTWATDQTHGVLRSLNSQSYSSLRTEDGNAGTKDLDELQKSFSDKIAGVKDDRLKLEMQRVSAGLVNEAKNTYLTKFEAKKKDHYLGVFETFENQQFNKTVSEFDPKKRGEQVMIYDSALLDLVNGGVMGAETASKARVQFRNKIDKASADMLVDSLVPGSSMTPQDIENKLKDENLFPYLTIQDRAGKIHQLYTQSKVWRDDVRKEAETDALQNVHDVLGTITQIKDTTKREIALVGLEGLIDQYAAKRTLTPATREHLRGEIVKMRAGKDMVSDPQAKLDLMTLVATNKIDIKGIYRYPGVSLEDKADLVKYENGLNKQLEAIGRAAENQRRALERADRNLNMSNAITEIKHRITKKGPLAGLDDEEAYWSAIAVQDVIKHVAKGGDPWDVVANSDVYSSKMEVPFISVPGSKWVGGIPKSMEEVKTLKTWVPYYLGQGKTKEANILAGQIERAERVLKARELNAGQKPKSESTDTRRKR